MSIVVDTPDAVAKRIADEIGGLPVDTVFVWASLGGMPEPMVVEHTTTLCRDLAPLVADL